MCRYKEGQACSSNSQCGSNDCSTTCQRVAVNGQCGADDDCSNGSDECYNFKCLGEGGATCSSGSQCLSGSCLSSECEASAVGQGCVSTSDCSTDLTCINGLCLLDSLDSSCTISSQCVSGNCNGSPGSPSDCGRNIVFGACLSNSDCYANGVQNVCVGAGGTGVYSRQNGYGTCLINIGQGNCGQFTGSSKQNASCAPAEGTQECQSSGTCAGLCCDPNSGDACTTNCDCCSGTCRSPSNTCL